MKSILIALIYLGFYTAVNAQKIIGVDARGNNIYEEKKSVKLKPTVIVGVNRNGKAIYQESDGTKYKTNNDGVKEYIKKTERSENPYAKYRSNYKVVGTDGNGRIIYEDSNRKRYFLNEDGTKGYVSPKK